MTDFKIEENQQISINLSVNQQEMIKELLSVSGNLASRGVIDLTTLSPFARGNIFAIVPEVKLAFDALQTAQNKQGQDALPSLEATHSVVSHVVVPKVTAASKPFTDKIGPQEKVGDSPPHLVPANTFYDFQMHLDLGAGLTAEALSNKALEGGMKKDQLSTVHLYEKTIDVSPLGNLSNKSRLYIIGHCNRGCNEISSDKREGTVTSYSVKDFVDMLEVHASHLLNQPSGDRRLKISVVACHGGAGNANNRVESFAVQLSRALAEKGFDVDVVARTDVVDRAKESDTLRKKTVVGRYKEYLDKVTVHTPPGKNKITTVTVVETESSRVSLPRVRMALNEGSINQWKGSNYYNDAFHNQEQAEGYLKNLPNGCCIVYQDKELDENDKERGLTLSIVINNRIEHIPIEKIGMTLNRANALYQLGRDIDFRVTQPLSGEFDREKELAHLKKTGLFQEGKTVDIERKLKEMSVEGNKTVYTFRKSSAGEEFIAFSLATKDRTDVLHVLYKFVPGRGYVQMLNGATEAKPPTAFPSLRAIIQAVRQSRVGRQIK